MTIAEALTHPTARVILLAEITAGIHFRKWIVDGIYTETYKIAPEGGLYGTSLATSLVEHFKLDEASGDCYGAKEGYRLTESGTITRSAGKLGTCADFGFTPSTTRHLTNTDDDADFDTGDIDFSVCFWVYPAAGAGTGYSPVSKWDGPFNYEWTAYFDSFKLSFRVSAEGDASPIGVVESAALASNTWSFVAMWHDAANDTINIQINNGTVVSTSWTFGVFASAALFNIGGGFNSGVADAPMEGAVDSVSFWKRVLTTNERTALYNAGAGLDYPFTAAGGEPEASDLEITSVLWDLTTTLTERASATLVNSNAGSWYWDGSILWVRPPTGESIYAHTVQAFARFYFSNPISKIVANRYYDPRLLTAPDLSQRIEAKFGGVGQIGGGNLVLANADGFFDARQDYQWDAGSIVLKLGVDLPQQTMADGDYETIATWTALDWKRDEQKFTLRVIEPKAKIKTKLPLEYLELADYPNLDEAQIGKAIPIAYGRLYGREPILVDPGAKQFKIAGHAIREFSAVRLEQQIEEPKTRTPSLDDWHLYSGTVYRFYLAGEDVNNVTFDGASLTQKNSIADTVAAVGSWCFADSYVYVRPDTGETISSGVYVIESVSKFSVYRAVDFATIDLANGEFTLGDDWTIGQGVVVDILGKTDGGDLIASPVDVIEDLLTTAGETNLNAASFATARERLYMGTDESGEEVHRREIGLHLTTPKEALTIIGEILAAISGYLYTDPTGQLAIGIWTPQPGESLNQITDLDLIDFEEITDTEANHSKRITTYAQREREKIDQIETTEATANQYLHGQPLPVVEESASLLVFEQDVEADNARRLILEGSPLKKWSIRIPWIGLTRKPGEQLWLDLTSRNIKGVFEILEHKIDLGSKTVQIVVGNLRGFGDSPGFLVDAAATLPTRFSDHAGYGTGSLVWNSAWSAEIKAWARQNVGYWCDENGFADPADPDSFMASTYI